MSRKTRQHRIRHGRLAGLLYLSVLAFAWVPTSSLAAEAAYGPCAGAEVLIPNTTLRHHGGAARCFQIHLDAPGLATFDISTKHAVAPGDTFTRPTLRFLGAGSSQQEPTTGHQLLRESPQGAMVYVRTSGIYFLIVTPEDPEKVLSGFKLRNAFGFELESLDELVGLNSFPVGSHPDRDIDEPDEDDDIGGSGKIATACSFGEIDDHGDTWLCATPLAENQNQAGLVSNAFGDDEDYFTFILESQETVALELQAGATVDMSLYDANGQLLSFAEAWPGAGIIRTLSAGRYYLRLWSSLSTGETYTLRLRAVGGE